jgi:hypothetical protein
MRKEDGETSPANARPATGGDTMRRRLLALTATLIIPAAVAGMLLLAYAYTKERAATALQVQATARALSIVVDRQLGQAEALIRALGTAPSLIDGDFASFDRQARAANKIEGSWVVVLDTSGRQLVNTRLPPGTPLLQDQAATLRFDNLLTGSTRISNLITVSPVGAPVVGIDIPVLRDGEVLYDLAIVIPPSSFDRVFQEQRRPRQYRRPPDFGGFRRSSEGR